MRSRVGTTSRVVSSLAGHTPRMSRSLETLSKTVRTLAPMLISFLISCTVDEIIQTLVYVQGKARDDNDAGTYGAIGAAGGVAAAS